MSAIRALFVTAIISSMSLTGHAQELQPIQRYIVITDVLLGASAPDIPILSLSLKSTDSPGLGWVGLVTQGHQTPELKWALKNQTQCHRVKMQPTAPGEYQALVGRFMVQATIPTTGIQGARSLRDQSASVATLAIEDTQSAYKVKMTKYVEGSVQVDWIDQHGHLHQGGVTQLFASTSCQ